VPANKQRSSSDSSVPTWNGSVGWIFPVQNQYKEEESNVLLSGRTATMTAMTTWTTIMTYSPSHNGTSVKRQNYDHIHQQQEEDAMSSSSSLLSSFPQTTRLLRQQHSVFVPNEHRWSWLKLRPQPPVSIINHC
jgi:hypothetical protein